MRKFGFTYSQREHPINNIHWVYENKEFWPRQGHKQDLVSSAAYATSLVFLANKNKTMNYLFMICNSTLLRFSSARDIHSTITMLVSSVYFQSPQSKGGLYLKYLGNTNFG